MVTLYGIPNCDTMKKARAWLDANDVAYAFHNFKSDGIDPATLDGWIRAVGWQTLLNTRGMLWRKVPQPIKDTIDEDKARRLMLDTPSIIKRPVLDTGEGLHVGFKAEDYAQLFDT
ncbi:MAG: ArsC family reductase [Chromatiaceae bacterium]|jgi:arsenate reductase